ncbi:MAG: DUF559 domain-containing protein [Candidatus Omnitrophota bacterium]|nr:DUF559 domain-containing protein [Candidatus Omnitrophota bacterium]
MRHGWTPKEEAVLRERYPSATVEEILQALPGRPWSAILSKAARTRLFRQVGARYGPEQRRRMREAALSRYREHPELRQYLSAKTKALYRMGILKSPLAKMGNGQALPPYEELARIFLEPLGFQSQYTASSGRAGPPYTLDFGHPELKVVVEIDGKQHSGTRIQERDRERDAHLASLGWRVIRIRNESISAVLLEILAKRLPE